MSEQDLRIGLTGGFGTGKSTVAGIFRELSAEIIDADQLAREVLQPDREEYRQVVGQFGEKILDSSGEINRKALADEIFSDPGARDRLNRIVHPCVIEEMDEQLVNSPHPVTVAVIPLLFEVGLPDRFDYVVVVEAAVETVRKRVSDSRGLNEEEIERRWAAQLPLAEKVRRADYVVNNDGSLEETRRQVEEIWKSMTG